MCRGVGRGLAGRGVYKGMSRSVACADSTSLH